MQDLSKCNIWDNSGSREFYDEIVDNSEYK
jgi:hypothetical protein